METLEKRFSIENEEFYRPRFNAAPSQLLPVITLQQQKQISFYHWGVTPEWSKSKAISKKLYNILNSEIARKPSFKKALTQNRCVVPADGFYQWKKVSKKSVVPYRVTLANKELFSIPALYEEFENENDEVVHTFTVIVRPSVPALAQFDETMPVIFNADMEKIWLNEEHTEEELLGLLSQEPTNDFDFYTVSPEINDVGKDVPSLIHPTTPADQFGNYSLFD